MVARPAHAGEVQCGAAVLRGGARGALRRGGAGQQELEGALLEADDAVADVLGVREHSRRHDPRHVVRDQVGRVEARVARSVLSRPRFLSFARQCLSPQESGGTGHRGA